MRRILPYLKKKSVVAAKSRRSAFTLIEVVLAVIIILILAGITLPNLAGSLRGHKMRTAARTVNRMVRYGRAMAIMRTVEHAVVLNEQTMDIFVGPLKSDKTPEPNEADGELDQESLKRLGYIDDEIGSGDELPYDRDDYTHLPEGLVVGAFNSDAYEEAPLPEKYIVVHCYPDGKIDAFEIELKDDREHGIRLTSDPISGKIFSEFIQ